MRAYVLNQTHPKIFFSSKALESAQYAMNIRLNLFSAIGQRLPNKKNSSGTIVFLVGLIIGVIVALGLASFSTIMIIKDNIHTDDMSHTKILSTNSGSKCIKGNSNNIRKDLKSLVKIYENDCLKQNLY